MVTASGGNEISDLLADKSMVFAFLLMTLFLGGYCLITKSSDTECEFSGSAKVLPKYQHSSV